MFEIHDRLTELKQELRRNASQYEKAPPDFSRGIFGAAIGLIDEQVGEDKRHDFIRAVFEIPTGSVRDMTQAQKAALLFWVRPLKMTDAAPWSGCDKFNQDAALLASCQII